MKICQAISFSLGSLITVCCVAFVPVASAAPQPGDPCSSPGDRSADGTLSCSGQSRTWMHAGLPLMQPGQSCTRLGDMTYTSGEGVVTCRETDSGLVWVQTSRGN